MDLTVGERVEMRFSKWDGRPHWAYATRYLGEDRHGRWLWMPQGTAYERPGRAEVSTEDSVLCVPRESRHVLTTNAEPRKVRHYVDITTPPLWSRIDGVAQVSCVDLDLDVVERRGGKSYIDDEDEFADHQVDMAYPPDLVAATEAEARRVLGAVVAGEEPFASEAEAWIERGRSALG